MSNLILTNKRIALVTNIPRPYRVPLYEGLAQEITAKGGDFRVFFYSDHSKHLRRQESRVENGRYPHTQLRSLELSLGYERVISIPFSLLPYLQQYRPHMVISGAFGLTGYLNWLYCRQTNTPYIQWSGATAQRNGQGGWVSGRIQQFLARHATACLSYGSEAHDYLVQLGANPTRVVTGVNAVDTRFFVEGATKAKEQVAAFKNAHQLHGVQFLYVGNLVALKGLQYTLEAFAQIRHDSEFHFHLVGKGPAQAELQQQASKLGLTKQIHFWGSQPPAKVPFYYALADVFVFSSLYDVWGLVLNEAMSCGLPVVASSIAGATRDLVVDGENGFQVNPLQTDQMVTALRSLLKNETLRHRMGQQAAATIQAKATIQHSINAFLQAIHVAIHPL